MEFIRGDLIVRKFAWPRYLQKIVFRFRIDPVPGVRKLGGYKFRHWYKMSNALPDRRAYYEYPEYIRNKRSPKALPRAWDDYQRSDVRTRKSWKNKKIKKQWMKNG